MRFRVTESSIQLSETSYENARIVSRKIRTNLSGFSQYESLPSTITCRFHSEQAAVAQEQPPWALLRRQPGHARDRAHSPARCSGPGETLRVESRQSSSLCPRRISPPSQEKVRRPPPSRPFGKRPAPPRVGPGRHSRLPTVWRLISPRRIGAARKAPDWCGTLESHLAIQIFLPRSADCRFRL